MLDQMFQTPKTAFPSVSVLLNSIILSSRMTETDQLHLTLLHQLYPKQLTKVIKCFVQFANSKDLMQKQMVSLLRKVFKRDLLQNTTIITHPMNHQGRFFLKKSIDHQLTTAIHGHPLLGYLARLKDIIIVLFFDHLSTLSKIQMAY